MPHEVQARSKPKVIQYLNIRIDQVLQVRAGLFAQLDLTWAPFNAGSRFTMASLALVGERERVGKGETVFKGC